DPSGQLGQRDTARGVAGGEPQQSQSPAREICGALAGTGNAAGKCGALSCLFPVRTDQRYWSPLYSFPLPGAASLKMLSNTSGCGGVAGGTGGTGMGSTFSAGRGAGTGAG